MRIFVLCVFILLGTAFGAAPDLATLNGRFERLLQVLWNNHLRGICKYYDEFYLPGESWTAMDGCNECFCSSGGYVGCTEKYCLPDDRCPGGGMLWWHPQCKDGNCPVGYRCHKPDDICCPNAGCPRLNPYVLVLCIWPPPTCDPNNCNKCCPDYCGTKCHTDPPADPNNLQCPTLSANIVGICVELCQSNDNCTEKGELCCFNGCGHQCMQAQKKYNPNCPEVDTGILDDVQCFAPENCGDCGPSKICCPTLCGEKCTDVNAPPPQ